MSNYKITANGRSEEFNCKGDAIDRAIELASEYDFIYVYDEKGKIIWTNDCEAESAYAEYIHPDCIFF